MARRDETEQRRSSLEILPTPANSKHVNVVPMSLLSATCSVATSRAPKSVSTAERSDVVEEVLCARLEETRDPKPKVIFFQNLE